MENKYSNEKILFLDIDGVLNSHQSSYFFREIVKRDENNPEIDISNVFQWLSEELCPIALSNLNRIIEDTGCKIVISSTWRLGEDLESMKSWFKSFPVIANAIIDKTPSLRVKTDSGKILSVPRGVEIQAWLEDNNVSSYKNKNLVILDDDSDMWPLHANFILVDSHVGLDYNIMIKVLRLLEDPTTKNTDLI